MTKKPTRLQDRRKGATKKAQKLDKETTCTDVRVQSVVWEVEGNGVPVPDYVSINGVWFYRGVKMNSNDEDVND